MLLLGFLYLPVQFVMDYGSFVRYRESMSFHFSKILLAQLAPSSFRRQSRVTPQANHEALAVSLFFALC